MIQTLELISKLAYADTENDYNVLFENFINYIPQQVVAYYVKNWHGIREEWVKCTTKTTGIFF